MPAQTFWQKTKTGGKAGFDKLYGYVDKLGAPVNRLSNRLGSEAFWPTTLDKESDKAARILRSFCKDGFYQEESLQNSDGPQKKQKVLKKIPAEVIRNAKGLAIFTTMRTGLWVSGAGGSGILVGRLEDGSWSPPSGIMLHTAGLGFMVGVDIYDCVVVINSYEALQAFSKVRCTLGAEISATAGPVGMGGVLDTEVHKRQAPIFTYLKSRGFYAGVQIDGTIVIERSDENERFYNRKVSVGDIMAGKVRHPYETRRLIETIKAAQGDTNVDEALLLSGPTPADQEIVASSELDSEEHIFGVPDKDDPDPFGVLALEKAGLEIREAGTRARPSSETFSFAPSPTSPIFPAFNRFSIDSRMGSQWGSPRHSRRQSQLSIEHKPPVPMADMSTQTDPEPMEPYTPISPLHRSRSPTLHDGSEHHGTDTPATSRSSLADLAPFREPPKVTSAPHVYKPSIEINGHIPLPTTTEEPADFHVDHIENDHIANDQDTKDHDAKDHAAKDHDAKDRDIDQNLLTVNGHHDDGHDDEDDNFDHDDQYEGGEVIEAAPVVQQVFHSAAAPQMISRPRLVTVNKPTPPKLPPRSPFRGRFSGSSAPTTKDEGTGTESHRQSVASTISMAPSIDSVSSSIAKLRALNDSPNEDLDKVNGEHTEEKAGEEFHSLPVTPAPASPVKEKQAA